jgi:hypothetical protein
MAEADTVLTESTSPNGNVHALVEQYDDCCYLYLHSAPETELPLRSCWVRNLVPAPQVLDVARMRAGNAPMLPAGACAHPQGAARLRRDDLEIIWLEEGDAAALLERGEILAIVPVWAGVEGFEGYARDCTAQGPLCWPLGDASTNVLFDRVARARQWWASWDQENPWRAVQDGNIEALERALGKHTNYDAIDGGNWPPKAMLRFKVDGGVAVATCGVGIRPQPTVEMTVEDPSGLRRIELGMAVDDATFAACGEGVTGYISGQTGLPWHRHTWLGEGHTIPCDAFAKSPADSSFNAILLTGCPRGAPAVALPSFRGDPVNLLWAVPITQPERDYAMAKGSAALLERLNRTGPSWIHRRSRKAAV